VVALCALATHAAVYHALQPADAEHGYFSWYAPLVTVVSLLALIGIPLVIALLLLGAPGGGLRRAVTRFVPDVSRAEGTRLETARIAFASFSFLLVQESLERSLQLHAAALPSFNASEWLLLIAAVVALSHVLVWAGRGVSALVEAMGSTGRSGRWPAVRSDRTRTEPVTLRRSRPLALHGALRAPPALP
jgi:hypothetical protein